MPEPALPPVLHCDVAIIGSGPSGLAAAITLKESGLDNIIVLERDTEAGGTPRHCGHPPFGFKVYKRLLSGPAYARENVRHAQLLGIDIRCRTTVVRLHEGGILSLATPDGRQELHARRIIIASGTRETPRSARFIAGDRVSGIYNTGALQAMVYLKGKVPFRKPVIVGSEIVSFSALLTCRRAGIKPVAMIEENKKPHVRWPIYHAPVLFSTQLLLGKRIQKIIGKNRVTAVELIDQEHQTHRLDCDGILLTGCFTPESSLVRMSHLEFDSRLSPVTDNSGRCSDPAYYAAGNVIQLPAEAARNKLFYPKGRAPQGVHTSGNCWEQGRRVAINIVNELSLSG